MLQNVILALSGLAAVLSAIFAFITKRAENKTSNAQTVFETMREHMRTLSAENADQRVRITELESKNSRTTQLVNDLRLEVASCEADKRALSIEVGRLREAVNGRTNP